MLNKNVAALLAIFLGVFGTHQFYIGRWWAGVLQFATFMFAMFVAITNGPDELVALTMIIATVVPFVTGVLWAATPEERWRRKYDAENAGPTTGHAMYGANLAPADSSELKAEGIRYYRSADYDLAVEAFTEAVGVDYGDPGSHFNLACSFAQLGRYPEALQHLELSVTFGLPKPERIEKHPALGAMRKLPAFEQFRTNNYRRQKHVGEVPVAEQPTVARATVETIDDFNTPPEPAPEPAPNTVSPDLLEQISRLRELHDAGVLTPKEYQTQKERLLG